MNAPELDRARALATGLVAETDDGWVDLAGPAFAPSQVEVARCGPMTAWVERAGTSATASLWLDDGASASQVPLSLAAVTAIEPRSLAFDIGCEHVAFIADADGYPDLFVLDTASRAVARVTADAATDATPAWLLDGALVVARASGTDLAALYRIDLGDPSPTPALVLALDADTFDPAPSPDGRGLAFTRCSRLTGVCQVALASLDGRWTTLGAPGCESHAPVWIGAAPDPHTPPLLVWLEGPVDDALAIVAASSSGTIRGRVGTLTAHRLRSDPSAR
jgi:hypothetical protein